MITLHDVQATWDRFSQRENWFWLHRARRHLTGTRRETWGGSLIIKRTCFSCDLGWETLIE